MSELEKPDIIQVAQALNCLPVNRSGSRYWGGKCPAGHGSNSGRCFHIWVDTQSFYCFHCGAGSDVFDLIKIAQGCDFKDAVYWAKENRLISSNGHDEASYIELRKVHQILTEAARFFHSSLTDRIREHLQRHYGLTNETIEQYQIGYAPNDKSALKRRLNKSGFDSADIKKTGLMGKIGDSFFQGQIMFPYWTHGLVKYFIGRQTEETPKWKKGKYEKLPSNEFIKNDIFYGEDSIRRSDVAHVPEGVTDCLAALQHGLPSISPVTTRFRKKDHPKLLSLVRGKRVFLIPDNEDNEAGVEGAQDTLTFLKNNGIDACIISLPRPAGKEKVDFNEFVRDFGVEAFHKLVEDQAPVVIPKIIITRRFLDDKSNEAIKALETANHPPFLFRRSGTLARISSDEKQNPRIETINDNQLRGILARCAHFLKETEKGMVATSPPMDLVKDILALGDWNFPPLEGIIQVPALRLDGTVLNQPGYDHQTRLYYINPPDLLVPTIPENPSQDALEESLGNLLEIVCDFPFVEGPDRANALGLMFTLPLRPSIPGNIPMAAITAPTPGTGKGLFPEIVAILGTGKVAPMAGFPRDDDEMRKFITSRLIAGAPLIVFDNLELPLWGPSLSRALTCTEWEDRILSKNLTVRLPQRAVWIANGNNLKMRGDLPRRTFPIRLDAKMARPWERNNFKHKNLKEWVLRYRGDFLAAILTIARAWVVAGRPEPKKPIPVIGGFEGWSKTVGGILSFAGVDGFLDNLKQFHDDADLEGPEWEGFLIAWIEAIGENAKTCQKVAVILKANPEFASTLPDNLQEVLKDPEKSFERSLGRALARKENRPYGEKNLALQRDKITRDGVILWKVVPL